MRREEREKKKDLLFANVNKNTKSGKVKEEEEREKGAKGIYTAKAGFELLVSKCGVEIPIIYTSLYLDVIMWWQWHPPQQSRLT